MTSGTDAERSPVTEAEKLNAHVNHWKARAEAAEKRLDEVKTYSVLTYDDCFSNSPMKFHSCKLCGSGKDDVPIDQPLSHADDCPLNEGTTR